MSVRPIDIMMVPQMNEVSHIKQSENMRPATEQMNICLLYTSDAADEL